MPIILVSTKQWLISIAFFALAYALLAHTARVGALLHTRTRDVPQNVSTFVLVRGYRRAADTPRVARLCAIGAYVSLVHVS